MKFISIKGARTHNLKNIDLVIPRDKLVVITGLSGSGKSSLAFDTLYAEGQRRYVESLSTYARQFLSVMEKPDVDSIEGLSPAISIEQKSTSHNPRSTVGTITEIYDYLRLLFAKVAEPRCPKHNITLAAQTISQMVDQLFELPLGSKLMLLAPIIQAKKGEYHKQLDILRDQGFVRARIDGVVFDLDGVLPKLDFHKKHTIEVVIDRLMIKEDYKVRLADSLAIALNLTDGLAVAAIFDEYNKIQQELEFSSKFACKKCGYSITELEPRQFSFNSPQGACSVCDGLGVKQFMDPELLIVDDNLSLAAGAIRGWDRTHQYHFSILEKLAKTYEFSLSVAYKKLNKKIKDLLLTGDLNDGGDFEGIINNLERRYLETNSDYVREELAKFLSKKTCVECNGSRLNLIARHTYIQDVSLPQITRLSIENTKFFFEQLQFTGAKLQIAQRILKEIITRLNFLINVGLEYLTLDRSADTLSGGESQRIRLASQIGAGLVGVMYVLDEPSIGLHPRDNDRLIKTLTDLKALGNSVIVVEHDYNTILSADYVVDVGIGAGVHGGEIIASGTPSQVMQNDKSLTGKYLSGVEFIAIPKHRVKQDLEKQLIISGVSANNLQNLEVFFPIGLFICVTGVSGSGKSTLVNDTLYPILAKKLNRATSMHLNKNVTVEGLEYLDKVIDISQDPIGRTPRSNPATYTGLFTNIRDLFAAVPEAKARGYAAGRFSFNVKGGRCEACSGDGLVKVEMHFLADVYVMCDVCAGSRYNRETLEIYYKGKNIYEVLNMTVEEALLFFTAIPSIKKKLSTLLEVGLGYIKLGQSATTLSGGEAQRVKLAKELSRQDTGKTLYILDEPTTGLHFHDVKRLLQILFMLRNHGNTIIVIEHNLDVVKTADWVIDLGPEGGDRGGKIVAVGTPEDLVRNFKTTKSFTGKFLAEVIK
ncbi:MAG: excinuclease ABC subunit UvrA [Gammaproteobacteria bacterium]